MLYKEEDVLAAADELKLKGENPLIIDHISDVDENLLDLERPIFRKDLTPTKVSHAVNFRILIDAMNQSGDLGDIVHRELHRKFPQYSYEFIKNPHNWCSLDALDYVWQTIKDVKDNQNPRMLSDLIKHNIVDKSFFDSQDVLIMFSPVNILFEGASGVNRNSDENYILQHISTKKLISSIKGVHEFESYFIGTYFSNFLYDQSVRYTNEMFGNGLLKGLPARKNFYFAEVDYRASVMKLENVISVDYGYLNLKFERTDAEDGTFLINGKSCGHKVVAIKKKFKQEMSFAGRLINKNKVQSEPEIYDFFNIKELSDFSKDELEDGIKKRHLTIVDQFDKDILDTTAYRHKLDNSHYAFKKGDIFSAPYTSYKVRYSTEKREISMIRDKNIFNIAKKDETLFTKIIGANKGFRMRKRRDILLAHLIEAYLFEKDKDRQTIEEQQLIIEEKTAELKKLAEFDELTNIYNRRGFLDRAKSLYSNDLRNDNLSAVVIIDIDYFKKFNDHYGHIKGDACLQYFASVIKEYGHRGSDIVGRYGGEEFILFLPSTNPVGAECVVKSIISDLHEHPYEHIKNTHGILTASFGIAYSNNVSSHDLSHFIHAADLALYQAKDHGRDRFEVYDPDVYNSIN